MITKEPIGGNDALSPGSDLIGGGAGLRAVLQILLNFLFTFVLICNVLLSTYHGLGMALWALETLIPQDKPIVGTIIMGTL